MFDDRSEFQALLRLAIGNRTQAQFANEAGISAEHLNRLLNSSTAHCPTQSTLTKIASVAQNGVMRGDLERALYNVKEDKVKPKDFKAEANRIMAAFASVVKKHTFPIMVRNLSKLMDDMIAETYKKVGNALPISYLIRIERPYPSGLEYSVASNYVTIEITMAQGMSTATADLVIYFNKVPDFKNKNAYVIYHMACDLHTVFDIYGFPPDVSDVIESTENVENVNEEIYEKFPKNYYLSFDTAVYMKERYIDPNAKTPQERFMSSVFGSRVEYPMTYKGIGFWIKETPPKFLEFVKNHWDGIANHWPDMSARTWVQIEHKIDDILENPEATKEDIARVTEEVLSDLNMDLDETLTECMSYTTGFPIAYMTHTDKPDDPYMSKYDCVMLEESESEYHHIQREAALMAIANLANELGIDQIGDILFTNITEDFLKHKTYKVNENKPDENECPRHKEMISRDYSIDPSEKQPDADGLYWCKLKDGRMKELIYVKNANVWLMHHKEWTAWIDKYDPTPIELESDSEE